MPVPVLAPELVREPGPELVREPGPELEQVLGLGLAPVRELGLALAENRQPRVMQSVPELDIQIKYSFSFFPPSLFYKDLYIPKNGPSFHCSHLLL